MDDELRMKLADLGSPEALASCIVDHYPNIEIPIPLERIAYAVGIVDLIPQTTSSFEGVLVTDDAKSSGSIAYNEASGVERRRFTICPRNRPFFDPMARCQRTMRRRRHGGIAETGTPAGALRPRPTASPPRY